MKTLLILIALLLPSLSALAQDSEKLKVVTTLSTFADIASQIGGDAIEVKNIASPKFNPHFIEPRPSDILRVKNASLFAHAGLDLELWRLPLVDAAANSLIRPGAQGELRPISGHHATKSATITESRRWRHPCLWQSALLDRPAQWTNHRNLAK